MRPSRSRTLQVLAVIGLGLLAVRPVPLLERALDLVLVPARALSELAAPVGWVQGRPVLAAGPTALREAEREEHRRLEAAVLRMARPTDPALALRLERVGTLRAEVIGRPRDELDRIRIRLEDPGPVRHGQPVVSGDHYVGEVDLKTPVARGLPPDVVEVVLVTARQARVGARVADEGTGEPCRMVVGGLAPVGPVRLDVHNPSDLATRAGRVVVAEPDFVEGLTHLADGFLLGELVTERGGGASQEDLLCIEPRLDYESGLYQVLVLTDPQRSSPGPARPPALGDTPGQGRDALRVDALEDGRWAPARLFLRGEPSPWRKGRKLAMGWYRGVFDGAVLASGTRLAGRVGHAAPWSADVSLVADPGFEVPALALAQVDGAAVPHVLGRIVSLGQKTPGVVRFLWQATLELPGTWPAPVTARLWTGSGAGGVPRGLLIGDTTLPAGPGPHVLEVALPGGAAEPRGLAVRLISAGERAR